MAKASWWVRNPDGYWYQMSAIDVEVGLNPSRKDMR
jgi:hypothetical protein